MDDESVVTEAELAARWRVKVRALGDKRRRGEPFPVPFQLSPRRYRRSTIEEFEAAQEAAQEAAHKE